MKRLVSIFVVFALVVTSVFAAERVGYAGTYEIDDNDIKYPVQGGYLYFDERTGEITGCDKSVTEVVIPDRINGAKVTSIGKEAFEYCSSLTSISIPEGVASIGEWAFSWCSSLTSIEIPDGVTSIGEWAFMYCSSLISIRIPDKVTSIGEYTFGNCRTLTSIKIPEGVMSIGDRAFSGCSSLTSIKIPEGVTSIGYSAFSNCSSLTSVKIPDGVTSIESETFSGCSSLTSIKIPEEVTSIGEWAFSCCSSLTSIEIPDGVTSIGNNAFNWCSLLKSIKIPDGVTSIGDRAFSYCSSLTSIKIPEGVTSIGYSAFSNCSSLTSVKIPDGVTSIESETFSCCSSLTSIKIPAGVTSIESGTFSGCSSLTSISIPAGVTSIGEHAFYWCSSLTSISIPDGVTSIGHCAFSGCSSLTSIKIPDGVTSIEYMVFSDCSSLTSIKIPDGVTSIESETFSGCSSLTSIKIPAGVTSIGEWAFSCCSSLTSIKIPDGVTSIGEWAFSGCSSLTSIKIPDGVTSIESETFSGCSSLTSIKIPAGVTSIGEWAFSCCSSLTSIKIPAGVTSIESGTFSGCSSLTSISIPAGVTSIGELAFYWCSSLTSISIPAGVTSIGEHAFYWCSSLTSIKIPEGVEVIEDYAFYGCSSLTSIEIPASVTEIGRKAFNSYSDDLVIYGYAGSYAETYAEENGIKFEIYTGRYKASVPKGKYGIFVIDSKGKAVRGADVKFDSYSGVTDSKGLALFPKWTEGTPLIEVSCDGYITYSNENTDYEKSSKGYDVITLYKTSEAGLMLSKAVYKMGIMNSVNLLYSAKEVYKPSSSHLITVDNEFSITCTARDADAALRYELWQNNKKIAESADGKFKALKSAMFDEGKGVFVRVYDNKGRAVNTHINLEIVEPDAGGNEMEIGENIKFTISDDVPLLGGHQVKLELLKRLPLEVKLSDDTCYFGFNIGDFEEKDVKEIRKNIQLLKNINKLGLNKSNKKSLKKLISEADSGTKPDFDIQVVGYGECKLGKNGKPASEITLYLGIQATGELSKQWNYVVYAVPVTVHFDVGVDTEAGGEIVIDSLKSQVTGDVVLKAALKSSLFLGVGVGKLASAGGYGSAALEAETVVMGSSPNGLNSIDADLEAGVKLYILGMVSNKVLAHGRYNLYKRTLEANALRMMLQTEAAGYDLYRTDDFKKQDLSYLADKSEWLDGGMSVLRSLGISQSNEIKPLITSVYENSTPSVVSNGETMVMAYLDADVSRGAGNATVVKYSIYDESTGTWGEPVRLDSNNTADYQPQLYLIGQDIYLTYRDCSTEYGDKDDTALEELVKQQNICTAKFNNKTGVFEIVNTIAADTKYRSCQTAGTMNGAAVTAWVENSGDDIFNRNDTNEIRYSTYGDTGWSEPVNVITGARCVTALAVTDSGIGYVSDTDTNLSTEEDKVLYIGQVAVDSGSISGLKVCDGMLMWTNDGILKKYDGQSASTVFDDIRIPAEFVFTGNTIYYTVAEDDCSNIYKRVYDAGSWSEAVKITSSDRYIEYLSAAKLNGNVYAAFTDTKVTIGDEDITRECNLAWCRLEEVTDLTVEDAEYDSAAVAPNSEVPVSVTVRNSGSSMIDTAGVTVTDENGTPVYQSTVTMELAAGASTEIKVPVTMGETVSEHTYSISVYADGDRNYDDNTIETVIGYTDFELECEQVQVGDVISLYMTVTNRSYAQSSGRVEITCGDKCTYTADVPVLEYGESSTSVANLSEIALSEGSSGQIRVEAIADAGEDETYNNYELVYLDLDYDISYYAQAEDQAAFKVQSKSYDEYTEITEDKPVRDGYRFMGWSADSSAEDAEYTAGDSISSNRSLTLYGVWQESTDYTVKGSIVSGSDEKAVVKVYPKDTEKKDILNISEDGDVSLDDSIALPYHVSVGESAADEDTYTLEYSVTVEAGEYVLAVYIPGYGLHIEAVDKNNRNRDITLYLLGDANGDGKVRIGDKAVLARALAGWTGYDSLLAEEAADINGDGEVKNDDLMILSRHLAGWSRYKVLEYGMNAGQ